MPLTCNGHTLHPPAGDALWLPNTTRPAWLDGSLPGDRGFDPLGLSKPAEYLQVDVSCAPPPPLAVVHFAVPQPCTW